MSGGVSTRAGLQGNPLTFEHLVATWLDTHGSANTRSAYGADLAVFGRWCAGREAVPLRVTAAEVVAYQSSCEQAGESPSTIRRRSSALSSFFTFALGHDAVTTNPVTGTNRPQVEFGDPSPTPALGSSIVDQYLDASAAIDVRLHALVVLLALDGLKLGESLALDVTDISGREPTVSAAVSRPGGTQQLILHGLAGGAVRRCAAGRSVGPLFVSGRPAPADHAPRRLTRFGADHLIKRLPAHRGVPLTANALRRFYVFSSHAAGVHIDDIRARAGLRDVRSARRYLPTHTNPPAGDGSTRRAINKEV